MAERAQTTRFRFWLWLIRVIGVIVPRRLRADWRQEWEAELRYRERLLTEWDRLNWLNKHELLRRSASAFWDALVLQPQRWEDEMIQDLRFGLRMMRTQPGFTLIAVITLALGVGANAAVFSVVNAALLRPLPGYETNRLVVIWAKTPYNDENGVGGDLVREWRKQAQSFEQFEAGTSIPYTLTGVNPPEAAQAAIVTAGYFSLYRAQAALGRLFAPGEDGAGRDHVTVLDHDYWLRRFGGDPAIVGKTIKINREDYVVVGVAPADFHPLGRGQTPFYLPLAFDKYNNTDFWVVARLKPGVTFEQAKAEMSMISRRIQTADPKNYQDVEANLVPILETWVAQIRTVLLLLFGAVAVVLLIACANVANLLLARGAARRHEFAIRLALGASRFRLVRQMMVECLMLALIGGGIGLLSAAWIVSALGKVKWIAIPRLDEAHVDWSVLGFNFLAAICASLLCGIGPALLVTRQDVGRGLEVNGRGFTGGRSQNRARHALVVAEIAGAFALLYAAGLLTQSFMRMQRVDLGYDPRNVLTFAITLPESSDAVGLPMIASYDRITERIRRLPGVESVGLTTSLPTGDGANGSMDIKLVDRPAPPHNGGASATLRIVSADYFRALRIPLLAGRLFDDRDSFGHSNVVIISKAVARRFFPDRSPLGQRLLVDWLDPNLREGNEKVIAREIVGVVGDVKQMSVTDQEKMELLAPYRQNGVRFTMVAARVDGDPLKLAAAIRREVAEEDKDLPISDVKTMAERATALTAQSQTSTLLFGVFAALSLLLSALGIYGVMAYAVAQRTHEIGVRMALGANPRDALALILRKGFQLTLGGVIIGLLVAWATTRLLTGMLYGVNVADPLTFGVVSLLLVAVALLACFLPARRATKVDPLGALRCE
jgi:putative ABC transport system permease protein